jgi:hypothetical protein
MGVQYPVDLTEAEAVAGFSVQEIDNPNGRAATPPLRLRAVVYQPGTDPSELVVKVYDPASGAVEYHRQLHGVSMPTVDRDVPTWKLCGRHADPAEAVADGARQADLARLGRSVVQSPPAISREDGAA